MFCPQFDNILAHITWAKSLSEISYLFAGCNDPKLILNVISLVWWAFKITSPKGNLGSNVTYFLFLKNKLNSYNFFFFRKSYGLLPQILSWMPRLIWTKQLFSTTLDSVRDHSFGTYAMQNITTDRAQKVDEKNGAICLDIMVTFRVMFIKMSKWLLFSIFCWWQ